MVAGKCVAEDDRVLCATDGDGQCTTENTQKKKSCQTEMAKKKKRKSIPLPQINIIYGCLLSFQIIESIFSP